MAPSGRAVAPRFALLNEQRYRRRFLREDGKQTSFVMAAVSICYVIAAANDFSILRGSVLLPISLATRGLLFVATVVVIVLIHRARWPRQQNRAFQLGLVATGVLVSANHLLKIPSGRIQGPVIASLVLLCVLYFAQRGPLAPRVVVGSGIALGGVAVIRFGNSAGVLDAAGSVTSVLALVALNIVGILSARGFEEQRRKRFDAERQELQARCELALARDRAEASAHARTAFLAAMSHEFRTPMNAVIGLSDILLDARLEGEHHQHVRAISESARALLGLLNDILDFAKIDAQKLTLSPVSFDPAMLAASIVDMLRPAATERGLDLTLELDPGVPERLVGDDVRLRQVLVNLVSNAVKFTERGAVTLQLTAGAKAAGGAHAVAFRVEDTGLGMTPDVVARLFRPFEQANSGIARSHGGTGLGLAISKQIIAAMGGDIAVESEPGKGSAFSFSLVLAAPTETAAPASAAALAPQKDRPPLVILVVDDNVINRSVAGAKLARLGYPVDLASDGSEAVLAVTRKAYDIVFMDLQMPGMSGIEATARIADALPGPSAPHIIAMTASVYEEDREACLKAGMRDFVGKPIDYAELDAVLRRVAEERGAEAPKAAPVATLSIEMLSKLRQIESLGEPEFVATLARRFVADTQQRLPRMADALGRGDAEAIAREAHIVTSSSATLGATEMSELCARIERSARRGRIDEIGAGIDALALKFGEVERALAREIQGGAP